MFYYLNKDLYERFFLKIVSKFKNYCPISIGSIDVRYDNKNPAELYVGTTWELLTSGKYIQSGSTALSTGGSNSVSISKANLPAIKVQLESFSVTTQPHRHEEGSGHYATGKFGHISDTSVRRNTGDDRSVVRNYTSTDSGANTGTASPYTQNLGNGTALSIQPAYITLKFWKRLT